MVFTRARKLLLRRNCDLHEMEKDYYAFSIFVFADMKPLQNFELELL